MPELPEVETLRCELARALVGKEIKKFESTGFKLNLAGQTITAVSRRAKILIFALKAKTLGSQEAKSSLLVHLKMTGQLIYEFPESYKPKAKRLIVGGHPQENPLKYTRATFFFTDNGKLFFNDLRKFGWLKLVSETDLPKIFGKTGMEPLSREFTLAKFQEILRRYPRRRIKALLLDQTQVAGLGNIYADESCFWAGVRPMRLVKNLSGSEIKKLHAGIRAVLKLAIKKKGTSFRDYRRSSGEVGGMVPYLMVYGREGKPCKVCGVPIIKIRLNGRGTHYCPRCQK